MRRAGITGKTVYELIRKTPEGCWLWQGTIHKNGQPVFRGWQYPRLYIYHQERGSLPPGHRFAGQYCGQKICLCPNHQIIVPFPRREILKGIEPKTLEVLDELVSRGFLLMPSTGHFTHLKELITLQLAFEVSSTANYTIVKPTPRGVEIAEWRKSRATDTK